MARPCMMGGGNIVSGQAGLYECHVQSLVPRTSDGDRAGKSGRARMAESVGCCWGSRKSHRHGQLLLELLVAAPPPGALRPQQLHACRRLSRR